MTHCKEASQFYQNPLKTICEQPWSIWGFFDYRVRADFAIMGEIDIKCHIASKLYNWSQISHEQCLWVKHIPAEFARRCFGVPPLWLNEWEKLKLAAKDPVEAASKGHLELGEYLAFD